MSRAKNGKDTATEKIAKIMATSQH